MLAHAETAWSLEQLSLQLRWVHQFQFAGYYAAQQQGYYREAGLEVSFKEGGPRVNPVAEVLAGHSDFGIGLSNLVVEYLKGQPLVMLAPVFQHSPNVLLVQGQDKRLVDLARPDAGKIALLGGNQDVDLKAMFLDEGIALHRLRIVPNENHLQDFLDLRVEALNAYVSNEPYLLNQRHIPYTILKPQTYGMDFYGDVLFTSQALARSRPEVVEAFRTASMRGWQYALEHEEEIITLIQQQYNSQQKTRDHLRYEAREIERLINPEVIDIGHSNPGRWQHIAKTYARFGMVNFDGPLDNFFYQQKQNVDLSRFYWALGIISAILAIVGSIAWFIHRVNRRLAVALAEKSRSEEHHRVVFQTSPSAGIVWHQGFIVTDWNQQAEAVFGWKREEVLGRPFTDFLLPDTEMQHLVPELAHLVQENTLPHSINQNLTRAGEIITCEWFNAWLPERPGEPRKVISQAINITARLQLEEEIRQLAFFDPLTQLPNRRLLQNRLQHRLTMLQHDSAHSALIFLDLDNFKPLNDTHGHAVGDQLLIEVAQRLRACLRDTDTVARFGGDEFVVLLCGLDTQRTQAHALALHIAQQILHCLAQPYRLQRANGTGIVEHRCSASIGIALFDGSVDAENVLRRADASMYRAKDNGRNCIEIDASLSPEASSATPSPPASITIAVTPEVVTAT